MELLDRVRPHPAAGRLGGRLPLPAHQRRRPGFGTVVTSALFLTVILGLVVYLAVTRKDVTEQERLARRAV
ncbi:hypothetical protein [Streptomyces sp. SAS_272]|uniref:hypothetical protein n=1 Tax=Streptomyces sp. SAS_272 TaxID=3412747 RepID=UPI00403C7052